MSNQAILITGGTGKLGQVLVRHFGMQGHSVIFTARSQPRIDELLSTLNLPNVRGIITDLEAEHFAQTLCSGLDRLEFCPTALINNARNLDHLKVNGNGPSRSQWMGELALAVVAPFELGMALADLPDSRLKKIVNVGSMYGVVPFNTALYDDPTTQAPIHYSVAKAAQVHLTKEMAIRLAERGVQVNAVSFGGIEGRVDEAFKARYAALCPMGRMLKDEEVIGAVDFLISDQSVGVIGHNLVVDGGWSTW